MQTLLLFAASQKSDYTRLQITCKTNVSERAQQDSCDYFLLDTTFSCSVTSP